MYVFLNGWEVCILKYFTMYEQQLEAEATSEAKENNSL